MFFDNCLALMVLTLSFLVLELVYATRRCGQKSCRDEQVCCAQGNGSTATVTCCKLVDKTYYNISLVTRKLSGVLIMLLLFAAGYFVQRVLCSRSRQLTQAQNGHPPVTASQDPLVESSTPEEAAGVQLPSYDESKRLPTYEETMRDASRATGATCITRTSI